MKAKKNFFSDQDDATDHKQSRKNIEKVLLEAMRHALSNQQLNVQHVLDWHEGLLFNLSYTKGHPNWLGKFRGNPTDEELRCMGIRVGSNMGVPPQKVQGEVDQFCSELTRRLGALEAGIKVGVKKTKEALKLISDEAGWAHGEWVRIHPFANGNGRTARLIANWILMHFRLRPAVRLRPRPQHSVYAAAGEASMAKRDHRSIAKFILEQLLASSRLRDHAAEP